MKALAIAFCLCLAGVVHADSITDNVAAMLTVDSSLPMAPGVALELAQNLMTAQEDSSYAASEPDSLTLSFAAVLRAISLEGSLDGVTEITNALLCPLPFLQSQIAIDDRVTLEIFVNGVPYVPGEVINFGDVPVDTPEGANELIMILLGVLILLVMYYIERKKRA